jgi:hypothetical protein
MEVTEGLTIEGYVTELTGSTIDGDLEAGEGAVGEERHG